MERSESVKVDISIFDESDPQEHQMKLLYGCGCNFGLRGNDEHTSLEVWNIVHGYFDSLHPCVGYEYYWMDSLPGKRHKLDVNNDQVGEIWITCAYLYYTTILSQVALQGLSNAFYQN